MNHRHAIHLGAAWEPPSTRSDGGTDWTRRFGRPAGLELGDRVLLVVTRSAVAATLAFNGVRLPPLAADSDRWTHDVTTLLRDRNELVVGVTADLHRDVDRDPHGRGPLPSACGRVVLEIVSASRLA